MKDSETQTEIAWEPFEANFTTTHEHVIYTKLWLVKRHSVKAGKAKDKRLGFYFLSKVTIRVKLSATSHGLVEGYDILTIY